MRVIAEEDEGKGKEGEKGGEERGGKDVGTSWFTSRGNEPCRRSNVSEKEKKKSVVA